jgi:type IV secretory pathway VirB4 component
LSAIIATIKDQEALLRRLGPYLEGGLYYEVFERQEPFQLVQGQITALSLQSFDDAEYTKNHFPKEKKLIEQFEYDLNSMRAVKVAIVLAAENVMQNLGEGPKIFAVDNFAELVNLKYYQHLATYMTGRMSEINGVSIFTINTTELALLKEKEISQNWIKDIATNFIFPSEISVVGLDKILGLEPAELRKLSAMTVSSRMFLIRQDKKTIASELSIGGLPALMRILCSGEREQEIYKEVVKEFGDAKPEDWVEALYTELENIM